MSIEEAVYIYSKMNDMTEEEVYELAPEVLLNFLKEEKKLGQALAINNLRHKYFNEVFIPRLIAEERFEELQKIKLEEEKQLKEMDEMINSYRRKWGLDEL